MTLRSNRLVLTLGGAALLLTLGIWVNTGTLAPYGATLKSPLIWAPCKSRSIQSSSASLTG